MCPEWNAGILSSLTFTWLSPLIRKGYKTPLQDKDIWSLPPADRYGAGLRMSTWGELFHVGTFTTKLSPLSFHR